MDDSSMFCELCKSLSIEKLITMSLSHDDNAQNHHYYCHQPSFDALQESACSGCPLCKTLLLAILEAIPSPGINLIALEKKRSMLQGILPATDIRLSINPYNQSSSSCLVLETLTVHVAQMVKAHLTLKTPAIAAPPLRLGKYQIGLLELDPDLGSDTNFRMITEWFEECKSQHDQNLCYPVRDTRLPTRVIDIGSVDGLMAPTLMESHGRTGQYVALSHVWGKKKFLCTSSVNWKSMQEHIPVENLSKTFQDAFVITRRLGFRYLWIDSLCILQQSGPDDKASLQDWEHESGAMGDIYEGAAVVLAAAGAMDGSFGMITHERPKSTKLTSLCRIKLRDNHESSDYVVLSPRTYHEEDMDFCFQGGPLAQRGSKFLAGVWQDDWQRGILWRVGVHQGQNTLSTILRAPSWSWAKMEGEFVIRDHFELEAVSSIYSAQLLSPEESFPVSEESPFGEVRPSSSLTIRGLTRTLINARKLFNESNGSPGAAWLDPKQDSMGGRESVKCESPGPGRSNFIMEGRLEGDRVYTLLMIGFYRHTVSYDYEKKAVRVHALILNLEPATQGTFRRAGVVVFDEDSFCLQDWAMRNILLV